jgi:hypothetical protein
VIMCQASVIALCSALALRNDGSELKDMRC